MRKLILLGGILLTSVQLYAQLAIDLAGAGNSAVINYEIPDGPFTVQYDMYMHSLQDFNGGVTVTCGTNPGPFDFYVNSSGTATSFVGNCGAFHFINPTFAFAANTWYNITYVFPGNGQSIQFYIDGVLAGTHSPFGIGGSSYSNFVDDFIRIGTRSDDATNADAKFDNLKVWSVARTQAELDQDRTRCFTGNEPGLDILLLMEEGTGTTLFDMALGNGAQNATINGAHSWTTGFQLGYSLQEAASACDSFTTPSGNYTWTTSGMYSDTLTAVGGCDSIINYNLTINTGAVDLGNDITQVNPPAVLDAGAGYSSYNWNNGGTSQTNSVSTSGEYIVEVVDTNGCSATDTVVVNFTVSLTDINGNKTAVKVFPNPASDALHLELESMVKEGLIATIVDINGSIVRETVINTNTHVFELNGLKEGVYFLKVVLGNEEQTLRFVVK